MLKFKFVLRLVCIFQEKKTLELKRNIIYCGSNCIS